MPEPLRLLVVEDSEVDYQVLVATLRRDGFAVESARVDTAGALNEALTGSRWDAMVTDHHMPSFDALTALAILQQHDPLVPAIVVSGEPAESLAVQALNTGAEDYILKGSLRRVGASLRRSLRSAECRRRLAAVEGRPTPASGPAAAGVTRLVELERKKLGRGLENTIVLPLREADAALGQAKPAVARQALSNALGAAEALQKKLAPIDLAPGVVGCLTELVAAFQEQHGIAATFRSNRPSLTCSYDVAITICRVAQEALDNVARHARAAQVTVTLVTGPAGISLEVIDNGVGAPPRGLLPDRAPAIAAMTERARLLGGSLQATSVEGMGTTVLLSLPPLPER